MATHNGLDQAFSQSKVIQETRKLHLRAISLMIFVTYWMMVFTFPDFFIINPNAEASVLRQVSLWLCLIGWLIQSLITPILIWKISDGFLYPLKWLPVTALWWPISIFLAQLTAFMETGQSFISYLNSYPIFVVTDIAIPLFVLWIRYEVPQVLKTV